MIGLAAQPALAGAHGLQALDAALFTAINRAWSHPVLDPLMVWATDLGLGPVQLALVALVYAFGGAAGRRTALLCLGAFVASGVASQLLKHLFHRPRPAAVMEEFRLLASLALKNSFPSGHTATSFALATVAGVRHRRWALPLFLAAALVGYSRVYLGMHFPGDVAGGAVLGVGVSLVCLRCGTGKSACRAELPPP